MAFYPKGVEESCLLLPSWEPSTALSFTREGVESGSLYHTQRTALSRYQISQYLCLRLPSFQNCE